MTTQHTQKPHKGKHVILRKSGRANDDEATIVTESCTIPGCDWSRKEEK